MQDFELYEQILGITTPWTVSRVELDIDKLTVKVYLTEVANTK